MVFQVAFGTFLHAAGGVQFRKIKQVGNEMRSSAPRVQLIHARFPHVAERLRALHARVVSVPETRPAGPGLRRRGRLRVVLNPAAMLPRAGAMTYVALVGPPSGR